MTNLLEQRIVLCETNMVTRSVSEHAIAHACGLDDEDWFCLSCNYTSKPVDQGTIKEIIKEAVNEQQEEDREIEARRKNLVL